MLIFKLNNEPTNGLQQPKNIQFSSCTNLIKTNYLKVPNGNKYDYEYYKQIFA